MRAKRKLGKTIYKSKKKRDLDDVRIERETKSRTSESNGKVSRSLDSQNKITNLKTGKKSYQNMKEEAGTTSTFMGDERGGEVSINKGKGRTYYSFDKDMNLKKDGKSIKEIDPIALGDLIEASASNNFDGYSKGGKMKAKKYEKGGQVGPPKGKKLTKKMVDKQHSSDLAKSMNLTNELAKRASTGLKENGFPMSKANKEALAKEVKKRKKRESTSKPNYRDVGKPIPGGASPRFKKGGKMMKYLKGGQVKIDANKDGKITGQDFKMLKKK